MCDRGRAGHREAKLLLSKGSKEIQRGWRCTLFKGFAFIFYRFLTFNTSSRGGSPLPPSRPVPSSRLATHVACTACRIVGPGVRSLSRSPWLCRISIIYGSVAFRAAATGEFLLQIAWLWAAAVLRCEPGQGVSRWRRWSYLLLIGLWCFTWWDAEGAPEASDHLVMVLGYSARLILFGYCVTRVFRRLFSALCHRFWAPGSARGTASAAAFAPRAAMSGCACRTCLVLPAGHVRLGFERS